MGESSRTKLSEKNKYYISENRRRELKYYCFQYLEWKEYLAWYDYKASCDEWSNPTQEMAIKRVECIENMTLIEKCCEEAAPEFSRYLLKAITRDHVTYATLAFDEDKIPCGERQFHKARQKFFYLLSRGKGYEVAIKTSSLID